MFIAIHSMEQSYSILGHWSSPVRNLWRMIHATIDFISSLLLAKIQNKFLGALSKVPSFLRKYIIKPKTTKSGHKMRNRAKKSAKEDL